MFKLKLRRNLNKYKLTNNAFLINIITIALFVFPRGPHGFLSFQFFSFSDMKLMFKRFGGSRDAIYDTFDHHVQRALPTPRAGI